MIPSLPALRAFDAAARLGSFRAAAEGLSVTPTAISHHVAGLEDALGVALFDRAGRKAVLTDNGKRLAEATGQAFGLLEDAVRNLRPTARPAVRLAAGPIFTARWLMPRISDFWALHPDIELEVLPRYGTGLGTRDDADIVIRWERLTEMPADAVKLLELRPIAIASAGFVARWGPIGQPADLLALPLLHQRNHWGWLDWFAAMGVPVSAPLRGAIFEDANVLLRGATAGQGVVIGWLPLIDQDLAEDRVVRLFDEAITPTHGYYVDARPGPGARRQVQRVIDWLAGQAG